MNPTPLPPICGSEAEITAIVQEQTPIYRSKTWNINQISAAFACALHMHQPTIPAGENDALISNLQYMFEHLQEGDNHNAAPFAWCYQRMGEFIPELINQGCHPRIMLDYSGNLLWGLQQMGREDILASLKNLTKSPYSDCVEWLGTMWSHAVVPSTPIPDLKLHILAWQHQFRAIFGTEALKQVKGFSPPEMHLPNHPDTLYEYIKALKECGYRWLLVQEHSVERLDGSPLHQDDKYVPNCLIARNSQGQEISIIALIKTQGSDTKLVAQMQPYHEAKTRSRRTLGNVDLPSCITQIADGENGGVMMNEYPRDFNPVWHQIKGNGQESNGVVGLNGTEYLELLESAGVKPDDYPVCQAVEQHKIWHKLGDDMTPEKVQGVLTQLKENDPNFHLDGASWTNDLSWVKGYENVLEPMHHLSALFHQKYEGLVAQDSTVTQQEDYQQALLYVLLLETSCFRYWGQGTWTDYAKMLYERGMEILHD
ncbi:glycosyl hydrolase family 57 [Roseofilum reptotaenium CS-1145]|uniref:Glycosyl hydrolase family 57 n=1 Tax=Roseofilum reptotaenium AO1-A TaxID=1925591 RepID=A0A1L9QTX9_9CYAN|nr:glycosyl hydrolase family 57 [Roseofilum reptotaenium]MDB9518383.1 glycosyl hydrolase family 57 [Roseofilum reptotaenium CS-1145]OJJ26124.1 glycosyl hydrolase family 57 [Roseofilum reptotaenium AO1-A]